MKAIMVKDEYSDITPEFPYEVDKIFCKADGHIKLKGSPRRYQIGCFRLEHNGKRITYEEAYRLQQLDRVREKLGV